MKRTKAIVYIAHGDVELHPARRAHPRRMYAETWFRSPLSAPPEALRFPAMHMLAWHGAPRLMMHGRWLETAGFPVGATVSRELVEPGVMVLRASHAE